MAKKKPTPLKILQGTFRKDRDGPEPEFTIAAEPPAPPAFLSRDGKAHWRELSPELHRLGLLTVVDVNALAMLCATWARIRRIERALDAEGQVIVGVKGKPVRHPLGPELHQQQAHYLKLLTEFGLTPASRGRVSFKGSTDTGGDNAFLFGQE